MMPAMMALCKRLVGPRPIDVQGKPLPEWATGRGHLKKCWDFKLRKNNGLWGGLEGYTAHHAQTFKGVQEPPLR
jgi:hypothetical protein